MTFSQLIGVSLLLTVIGVVLVLWPLLSTESNKASWKLPTAIMGFLFTLVGAIILLDAIAT